MTRTYYADQLDNMTCSVPGCKHSSHEGHMMYFHQACHQGKGVVVRKSGGTVSLFCAVCNKHMIDIAVNKCIGLPEYPTCHPDAPFVMSYMNGVAILECERCAEKQGVFRVMYELEKEKE